MIKVAIYARYSSDLQREASIEDQIRVCEERAKREGWKIVNCYTDHAVSGARLMRPGLQMLMQDGAAGEFTIVLAEALDPLSRDQEDIAGLYKRLQFAGVGIVTLSEGEISSLHIGLKGTMNALFLKDLADKTRRGLRGRVEDGKSGGGLTYGYDVVKKFDSNGEPIRGDRTINEKQAAIVRRIFTKYVAGRSPKRIAFALNREGVPGPSGKAWGPTTIYGHRRRGTGIINNELYIGRMVWSRLRYIKDPDTGKRVSRLNPEDQWVITEVPELRIVDQDLWDAANAKQKELEHETSGFWTKQRPQNLFSFLLKCGGGLSKVFRDHYGCSAARNKGTCQNRMVIRQDDLEKAVLDALQTHLMDPALCAEFCQEYTRRMNELRTEHNAALAGYRAELEKVTKRKQQIFDAIGDGTVRAASAADELEAVHNRKEELKALLSQTEEIPVLVHPNMAHRYQREVTSLVRALNEGERRTQAATLLRSLVEKIVLVPDYAKVGLQVDLYGDLAGILAVATKQDTSLFEYDPLMVQDKMVAGAGSDHNLRPEQVKMVAGTSTYHNLPPGGRPVELGDVCEIAKQMVLAAVECAEPQLLFRSAA